MSSTTNALIARMPADFRLGVADADLQVIGEDHCLREEGAEPTMWGHFAAESGKVYRGETPGAGIDRYHRWEGDARLMAELGFRHYRTSISWSRLLKRDGSVNAAACAWYRRYFQELKSHGIRLYATLYHWELPYHFHEIGGWKHRGTADAFVGHARAVVSELGEYIDECFILNEPWCSAHNSYYTGIHAPGETNLRDTLIAAHHLLVAQAQAFRAIKEIAPDLPVGTVVNIEPSFPDTEGEDDVRAARLANEFFNGWFLDPLFLCRYPEGIQGVYGESMPEFSREDLEAICIGSELSCLGVNYYQSKFVRHLPESPLAYEPVRRPGEEVNGLGWSVFAPPVHPPGLQLGLETLRDEYGTAGLPPIYITENGYAGIDDSRRIAYFEEHLAQTLAARENRVDVRAFFAWTFMDNYEWAEGYRPESRFGLVHVNRDSWARFPKESARWFAAILEAQAMRGSQNLSS